MDLLQMLAGAMFGAPQGKRPELKKAFPYREKAVRKSPVEPMGYMPAPKPTRPSMMMDVGDDFRLQPTRQVTPTFHGYNPQQAQRFPIQGSAQQLQPAIDPQRRNRNLYR